MVSKQELYNSVKDLPFANDDFSRTPKVKNAVINFKLAKTGQPVTLFNIHHHLEVPDLLIQAMQKEFNYIIEEGQTYPHITSKSFKEFKEYWFHHFASILIEGEHSSLTNDSLRNLTLEEWENALLGFFYVKPNYIGRSSHHCNAGFVVNHTKRGLGLGKELGAKYLQVAPQLGYVYSVFNLVFETNVASLKIWDSLGFERIGYVKNVAVLKGYEDRLVGAYMFGKDLQQID